MEYRATSYTRGFIWIMDIMAGWAMFGVLIVSNTMMYVLIDGFFKGDIDGVKYEK
jgi:hypothetical protein